MSEHPEPDTPRDDPDLEAALDDQAFDEPPGQGSGPGAAPGPVTGDDPGAAEDPASEPGAPHLSLEEDGEEQVDGPPGAGY